ncbi:MAG: 30S ribosome-binding factor RbfA [Pyrinomonadaceae bacterium MAG19_C2-C3]|nr:30S ribosome-binding factor RbfA [Pyrinomonadaceae bacterium MAG19_C2-C3]
MRRPERVAELLREEIVQIVGFELDDPRVASVTVTDVKMADNLRDARVFVTVEGTEDERRTALEALHHAAPYVRRQVGFALELRHAPIIHFVRDMVEERASRVDALLAGIKIEDRDDSTALSANAESDTENEGERPLTL